MPSSYPPPFQPPVVATTKKKSRKGRIGIAAGVLVGLSAVGMAMGGETEPVAASTETPITTTVGPTTAAPTTTRTTTAPTTTRATTTAPTTTTVAPTTETVTVYAGDPGYGSHLDRDGDGVGCES